MNSSLNINNKNELLKKELKKIDGVVFVSEQDLLEQDFINMCGFSKIDARLAAINVIDEEYVLNGNDDDII